MSGGHFNYSDERAKDEIFGCVDEPSNVFEDLEVSELIWDVFNLIHDYDWYICSDTCRETYLKSLQRFKDKWLNSSCEERVSYIIVEKIERVKQEILKTFKKERVSRGEPKKEPDRLSEFTRSVDDLKKSIEFQNKEHKGVFLAIEPFTLGNQAKPTPINYNLLCKAKEIGRDEWVYGYYLYYKDNPIVDCEYHHYIIDCNGCAERPIDPKTLCRCTGLPDKNGYLIFEGDICTATNNFVDQECGIVKYCKREAIFIVEFCSVRLDFSRQLQGETQIEIIGNIYDNPELLMRE